MIQPPNLASFIYFLVLISLVLFSATSTTIKQRRYPSTENGIMRGKGGKGGCTLRTEILPSSHHIVWFCAEYLSILEIFIHPSNFAIFIYFILLIFLVLFFTTSTAIKQCRYISTEKRRARGHKGGNGCTQRSQILPSSLHIVWL